MSKLFIQFITVIMSILCALNVGPAPSQNKPVQSRNIPVVEETEAPDAKDYGLEDENNGIATQSDDAETEDDYSNTTITRGSSTIIDETIVNEPEPEVPDTDPADEAGQDDAANQDDEEPVKKLPVDDVSALDILAAFGEDDNNDAQNVDLNGYEVVDVIDISENEKSNVTMTLFAPAKDKAATFAMENKAEVTHDGNKFARSVEAEKVTAVVSGEGDMQDYVYKHFINVQKFIYLTKTLIGEEVGLTADQIEYELPGYVDENDLIEVDMNIHYYACENDAGIPEGAELYITDDVRENLDPSMALNFSPETIVFEKGSNVTSISEGAFLFCDDLVNVVIPDTVKTIGENAFSYCKNLENIVIPEGVESIGARAFMHCSKLARIELPTTINFVDDEAFINMKQDSVVVCPDKTVYDLVNTGYTVTRGVTTVVLEAAN